MQNALPNSHSALLVLIDRAGKLTTVFNSCCSALGDNVEKIKTSQSLLLMALLKMLEILKFEGLGEWLWNCCASAELSTTQISGMAVFHFA